MDGIADEIEDVLLGSHMHSYTEPIGRPDAAAIWRVVVLWNPFSMKSLTAASIICRRRRATRSWFLIWVGTLFPFFFGSIAAGGPARGAATPYPYTI